MTANPSGIELGVSLYSYGADFDVTMTLEDCLADIADMGATGVEILSDTHIPNYPYPADEWIDVWTGLIKKYDLTPTCYDCWIDTRMHKNQPMSVDEAHRMLKRDMEIAHQMGFTIMRPKLGVVSGDLLPDPVWREAVQRALPDAERLNVRIAPEIHAPTPLKSKIVDDYLALTKETGTKYFGLLVDTGIFQDRERTGEHSDSKQIFGPVARDESGQVQRRNLSRAPMNEDPNDLLEFMPYVYHIHAKFWDMTDDLTDPHITWDKIVKALVEGGYRGSISSEYEGARDLFRASDVLRRQHVMLRRLLAENNVTLPTR